MMLPGFRRVSIAMLLLSVLAAVPAWAVSLTDGLAGAWTGTGAVATRYEGTPQNGRCKVEVKQSPDKAVLDIEGLCAVPSGRSEFALRAVLDSDSQVRAAVRANGLAETIQYAGTVTPMRMELVSRAPVTLHAAEFQSRFRIEVLADGQFWILHWLQPGDTASARQTLAIKFRRIPGQP
ncbi:MULTISPECIES: hypothetical protein [Roseobacteraceae]|uniref:hypothetical protein n=1 Tax=Roseobacteraceae TaxID=2854170 RepID=UPI002B26D120|nr:MULTISPECIES: hypothetical protein [Roseobacteraceae]